MAKKSTAPQQALLFDAPMAESTAGEGVVGSPEPAAPAAPTLLLIDGHGLAYRAHYAVRQPLTTTKGEPTTAVFSFTLMLLEVLNRFQPDQIVMTFDTGRTFRHELSADYKATRASMPDELRQQMTRIRQLVEAFDIPIREVKGFEADDVIGSLATKAAAVGYRVRIITGDSDLLQLVTDAICVVTPGANNSFSDLREYDVAAVHERFGFAPPLVADYKALVGDTSDNIAGVPGIGAKTATALLAQFGSVEALGDHLEEIKPPRARKALEEGGLRTAIAAKELTTIRRNLDIELDLAEREGRFNRAQIVELFRELEFRTLIDRLPHPWNIQDEAAPAAPQVPTLEYARITVDDAAKLDALVAELRTGQPFAIDVESDALDPIRANLVGIAIATSPTRSYYIPVAHNEGPQLPLEEVRHALKPLLADEQLPKYAHHGKYDLLVLRRAGMELRGVTFDTMIAAYLLGESSVGLKDLAFTRLGIEMTPIEALIGRGKAQITMDEVDIPRSTDYAGADVHVTYRLVEPFATELAEQDLVRVFSEIEMPLVPVLADMEQVGIALDVAYLRVLSGKITEVIAQREREIHRLAEREFNINSTQQLARVLFEDLQLAGRKKTQSGAYSTNQDVLEELRDKHPIVDAILEYRQLGKLKSTYVDALPLMVNPQTGRVHTSFNQTIASTGRLSSVNPNLQNIPIRTEIGREVRRAFVADSSSPRRLFPDEEAVLVGADYSQVELRLLAHFSGDENLIAAFRRGEDIHRRTAALVHGIPLDQVTSDQRRIAKSVNFGIVYGLSAYGLSRDTGMPVAEASRFIKTYFDQYPKVQDYLNSIREEAAKLGYVSSLSGRRRLIPDINSSNGAKRAGAERMAINMPIQGTAADLIKLAMLKFHQALLDEGLLSKLLLQVHDELVFEAPRSEIPALAALARRVMVGVSTDANLTVPLEIEVNAGANWGDMEPVEG